MEDSDGSCKKKSLRDSKPRLPVSLMFIYCSILCANSQNSDFEDRILKLVPYECNMFKISKHETKIIIIGIQ